MSTGAKTVLICVGLVLLYQKNSVHHRCVTVFAVSSVPQYIIMLICCLRAVILSLLREQKYLGLKALILKGYFVIILNKIISMIRSAFVLPIKLYQRYISPAFPARCKYVPTCSQYAATAIKRYGIIVGGALALWRIVRCNPWSKGGFDYVPEHLFTKKTKEK